MESLAWSATTATSLFLSHIHMWTHFYTLHSKDTLRWFTVKPIRSSGLACHFGMMADALGPPVQWILMVLNPSQPCCRGVFNMHASCGKRQTLQWSRKCLCFLYSEDGVRKCPETVSIEFICINYIKLTLHHVHFFTFSGQTYDFTSVDLKKNTLN